MPTEWFVGEDDRVIGPFTVAQLRAQAAANRIKPDTKIRRGRRGKWYAAKNVKGLLAEEKLASDSKRTSSSKHKASDRRSTAKITTQAKQEQEEGIFLAPVPNRKVRGIVLGCIVAFVLIGRAAIHKQLFFDVTVGLILGSFPIIEVKKKVIEQTIYVLFYPVYKHRWRLSDYYAVEADADKPMSEQFGCLVYVFFWYAVLWKVFDWMMPWLGGTYKLYLKDYADERTVIWQGNNTRDYEANLKLLESSGLRIG